MIFAKRQPDLLKTKKTGWNAVKQSIVPRWHRYGCAEAFTEETGDPTKECGNKKGEITYVEEREKRENCYRANQ